MVQVLANFMTECTIPNDELEGDDPIEEVSKNQWVAYVDGSSNANSSRARLVLISPEGEDIQYALCFGFLYTNNEAE